MEKKKEVGKSAWGREAESRGGVRVLTVAKFSIVEGLGTRRRRVSLSYFPRLERTY